VIVKIASDLGAPPGVVPRVRESEDAERGAELHDSSGLINGPKQRRLRLAFGKASPTKVDAERAKQGDE
jgi:hypothetical protein